jgi:hypothetical protein
MFSLHSRREHLRSTLLAYAEYGVMQLLPRDETTVETQDIEMRPLVPLRHRRSLFAASATAADY